MSFLEWAGLAVAWGGAILIIAGVAGANRLDDPLAETLRAHAPEPRREDHVERHLESLRTPVESFRAAQAMDAYEECDRLSTPTDMEAI